MARGRASAAATWVAAALLVCATGPTAVAADEPREAFLEREVGSGWSLALDEGFDRIDPDRWTLKHDTYSSNEDSFLLRDNCSIEDVGAEGRALRLQSREQTVRKWGDRWDYTSCYATTEGKFSLPDYFRAEVRAKVPMEQGMWAAPLWFRPTDGSGGEIDVVETLGREAADPQVHQTIHSDYGPAHELSSFEFPFDRLGDRAGTRWHTYTIEKLPGGITMWVDDEQTAQWSATDPEWFSEYYDAGKRWELRINLQVGGSWAGRPDSSTDWAPDRTAILVDRVRVWTPLTSQPPLPLGTWLRGALDFLSLDLF